MNSGPRAPLSNEHPLAGMGIYVHFPWCLKKCPYCDFLSIAVRSPDPERTATRAEAQALIPHASYADAVIAELKGRLAAMRRSKASANCRDTPQLPHLKSIFFGGGTPSLWAPKEIGRVISAVRDEYSGSLTAWSESEPEITVECNPTSVDQKHFEQLREAGVNRISIGVQSLKSDRLAFLGRLHDPEQAIDAIKAAFAAGIPQVSADLIYGVYQQAPEEAVAEVRRIAELGVHHLSAYMLTIEENTRFGAIHARGKLPLLDDVLVARSFSLVSEALQSLGFEHYEVSNFARPGHRSIHNVGYWLGRDYLGLGTGAYGTVQLGDQRLRYRNLISPERYMESGKSFASNGDPFNELSTEQEVIEPHIALEEPLMLGLRLKDGVDFEEVARVRGADASPKERKKTMETLIGLGKLQRNGMQLSIPPNHWLFADQIIRELL